MRQTSAPAADLDPRALLDQAIELHYRDLIGAVRRSGDGAAAAELVHDLYLRLADRPEALRGKRSLKAFLLSALRNLGIDRARRRAFEGRLFAGSEAEALAVPSQEAAPGAALAARQRLAILRRAIAELPARRRQVFVLHRLGQLGVDEIAGRLGITRNMVERHLRKALVHCLERLAEFD